MTVSGVYPSPLGEILLTADEIGLTDVRFEKTGSGADREIPPALLPAARWLDRYFAGEQPGELPPLHPVGTPFQMEVWAMLREIPYGKTCTYGDLSRRFDRPMSAQAIGGAVGKNKLSLFLPCHRVIGTDGSLTGYAWGLWRKEWLLKLEGENRRDIPSIM